MKPNLTPTLWPIALLLAALAGAPSFAWDNSAMIAQQQRDAARMAQERAMQATLAAQRQADIMQANRLSQMRQDNLLNDQRQAELRKSAERVYGLDKPVSMPVPSAQADPGARQAPGVAESAAGQRAPGTGFPTQIVWTDVPSRRILRFEPDGSFSLEFPKDGQFLKMVGRYAVDGQQIRLAAGQATETLTWVIGSAVASNGQIIGQLRLAGAQGSSSWMACAGC